MRLQKTCVVRLALVNANHRIPGVQGPGGPPPAEFKLETNCELEFDTLLVLDLEKREGALRAMYSPSIISPSPFPLAILTVPGILKQSTKSKRHPPEEKKGKKERKALETHTVLRWAAAVAAAAVAMH